MPTRPNKRASAQLDSDLKALDGSRAEQKDRLLRERGPGVFKEFKEICTEAELSMLIRDLEDVKAGRYSRLGFAEGRQDEMVGLGLVTIVDRTDPELATVIGADGVPKITARGLALLYGANTERDPKPIKQVAPRGARVEEAESPVDDDKEPRTDFRRSVCTGFPPYGKEPKKRDSSVCHGF
jgi:hypothetical protein